MTSRDAAAAASAETANLPSSPPCPFCEERDTELVSAFGSHASVSTYWCRRCRSPFELLKWGPAGARGAAGGGDDPPGGTGQS